MQPVNFAGMTERDARLAEAIHERPLSLVRAPDGIGGEQFFQKHSERFGIAGVTELPVALHPGHAPLMVANSAKALVGLAQMGVLELHTWNAVAPDLVALTV